MNASGQRRLTPLLGGIALALAAVCASFAVGVGRGVHWDDPAPSEPLPPLRAAAMPQPTPVGDFVEVWQRPLFMADRKPVAATDGDDSASNIGDLELTGIIMTSGLHMALLRDRGKDASAAAVRVKEGAALSDGHWTLASLTPRSAIFDNGGERRELTLKVAAPDPMAATPKGPQPPGTPKAAAPTPAQVGNGIHIEQQPASSGIMGPAGTRPAPAATRSPPPRQDDQALQQARIDALKEAVQRRRIEQQQQRQQSQQGQDSR